MSAGNHAGFASRRRFVTGLAASGAAAGLGLWPAMSFAAPRPGNPNMLTGTWI